MNARTILFPTDFSGHAAAALQYAVSLARDRKAEIVIVHVVEPGAVYSSGDSYFTGGSDANLAALKRMLGATVPEDATVRFRHVLLQGHPAAEIVRLADEEKVELILMATHGWTGLKHLLMGSVADGVARRANCPVLTVRPVRWGEKDENVVRVDG
jgi:universal stress protein A